LFDEAVRRIEKKYDATQDDLDQMAEILARGEKWGHTRGMQLRMCKKPYLVGAPDHFEELLLDARTPARKAKARGETMDRMNPASRSILEALAQRRAKEAGHG